MRSVARSTSASAYPMFGPEPRKNSTTASKLAPSLPIDGQWPFFHLDRKFMHLGFHIYDVGFQSPSVEAARPLVYATSLVLVMLIVILNIAAIKIRNNLREKYRSASD